MNKFLILTLFTFTFSMASDTTFDGLLFPAQKVILSSLSSGVVDQLPFNEGEKVEKENLLVGLNATKDSLSLVLSKREFERSKINETGEKEKSVALELKKISLEEKFIRAPFNGVIVNVLVKKHEYYSAGSKMIELADLNNLYTEVHLSRAQLDTILSGNLKIKVSRGSKEIEAKVLAHNPIAQPGLELFMLRLAFPNKYHWSPGTAVKIKF